MSIGSENHPVSTAPNGKPAAGSGARAFTLVELLVVIAIVAVLVAMLMPAIQRTQTQVRSLRCMSNLRQVSQALMAYAGDYHMTIPATRYNAQFDAWFRNLQGQGTGSKRYIIPSDLSSYYSMNPILQCPNANLLHPGEYALYSTGGKYPNEPSWVRTVQSGVVIFEGMRLERMQRPSDLLLIGDSSAAQNLSSSYAPDSGTFTFKPYKRDDIFTNQPSGLWAAHANRVNAIFADGHVEACDKVRLFNTSNWNGNSVAAGDPSDRTTGITWWKNQDFSINNY